MQNKRITPFKATHPGEILHDELAEREILQRDFAKEIGILPSRLNEFIKGKTKFNMDFAMKLEEALGIKATYWMNLQTNYDYDMAVIEQRGIEEKDASIELSRYEESIDTKVLLKRSGFDCKMPNQIIDCLKNNFHLGTHAELRLAGSGVFKKSQKVGRDPRMIYTWTVLAKYEAQKTKPIGTYHEERNKQLLDDLFIILHENKNTLQKLTSTFSKYGIGFCVVPKVEKASIDGFSYFLDGIPYIIVTLRINHIDNLAFAVMHEMCHIINHDEENVNFGKVQKSKEIEEITIIDDAIEKRADKFATEILIPEKIWAKRPKVIPNIYAIQKLYSAWAKNNNLNPWIVIGRVAYETGSYAIKGEESRKVM